MNKSFPQCQKTLYMNFGSYYDSIHSNLNIEIKHLEYIINKIKQNILVFMHKLSKIKNTETLLKIYYSSVHSLINYGNITWARAYNNHLSKLQTGLVNKNKFIPKNNPLNFDQLFSYNSLLYHYDLLKDKSQVSDSINRKK